MLQEKVGHFDASRSKDEFAEEYQTSLSKSHWLTQLEMKYQQTVNINNDEITNPNIVIDFLEYLQYYFNITLDVGTSSNFFKVRDTEKDDFETILDGLYEDDVLGKSLLRSYIYLVLLNRKMMNYSYNDNSSFNFDLRDIYYLNGIEIGKFDDVTSIPSNILKRGKVNFDKYQTKVRRFVRQLIQYEQLIKAKDREVEHVMSNTDDSDKKKEKKIKMLENQKFSIIKKVELLSFDIQDEVSTTATHEVATQDDIARFIATFVCYGIKLPHEVMTEAKRLVYKIHYHDYAYQSSHRDIKYYIDNDTLYFQDVKNKTWVKAHYLISKYVSVLAPTLRLNKEQLSDLLSMVVEKISLQKHINVFAFKKDCIFMKNGMIDIDFKDDGSISYQFINYQDISHREVMFKYATDYRSNVTYNDSVRMVFNDNPLNEPVTPNYIFGALGQRGYEVTDTMTNDERMRTQKEADARSNLFMQYFLKILMPYNDLPILKDRFMYIYNASNSGKSTYMKLAFNCVGRSSTANLSTKDFSSKESFGLVNIMDKRLILVDEATDGNEKIDSENIKRVSSKEYMLVNQKNNNYIGFEPNAEMIFASNNEPSFTDETEGTERRLLAMQLANGYAFDTNDDSRPQDFTFIKGDYIERDDFKSACIKWVLEHVDTHRPIPQSVIEDANSLIGKEDDVKSFVTRLTQHVDEPTFIDTKNLYELYKLECLANGRTINTIRNKTNFKKALSKIRHGITSVKNVIHSKVDVSNRLIALEGELFEEINNVQSNSELSNTLSKHFMDMMTTRKKDIETLYTEMIEADNKQRHLSKIDVGRKQMHVILPPSEDVMSEKELRDLINNHRTDFLHKMMNKTNLEYINTGDVIKLDTPINMKVDKSFNSYTSKETPHTISFQSFINYID